MSCGPPPGINGYFHGDPSVQHLQQATLIIASASRLFRPVPFSTAAGRRSPAHALT